jgi:hypothetical protein
MTAAEQYDIRHADSTRDVRAGGFSADVKPAPAHQRHGLAQGGTTAKVHSAAGKLQFKLFRQTRLRGIAKDQKAITIQVFQCAAVSVIDTDFVLGTAQGDSQAALAGDDNFQFAGNDINPGLRIMSTNVFYTWNTKRHHSIGNIAMGDGSVQSSNNHGLTNLLCSTNFNVLRLAIP